MAEMGIAYVCTILRRVRCRKPSHAKAYKDMEAGAPASIRANQCLTRGPKHQSIDWVGNRSSFAWSPLATATRRQAEGGARGGGLWGGTTWANCCHKRQIMRLPQPNRRQTSNWHKADMLNDVATCNWQLATGLLMTALLPTTAATRIAHLCGEVYGQRFKSSMRLHVASCKLQAQFNQGLGAAH